MAIKDDEDDGVESFINAIEAEDTQTQISSLHNKRSDIENGVPKEIILPPKYLLGISATMFGLGIAGGIKYSWKGKARPGVVWKVAGVFMAGTALCVGTFGLVVFGIAQYMQVNSMREFGNRMRSIVRKPEISMQDKEQRPPILNPTDIQDPPNTPSNNNFPNTNHINVKNNAYSETNR